LTSHARASPQQRRSAAPFRQRILPIIASMVGAAVSAEYLQAYLPETGDAVALAGGLLVLGPLYGGAALLIREAAIRAGLGWRGVLLLAAAFGLTMTSRVDGSMWLAHDPDIAYWDDLRAGTLLEPLGFAAYPVLSWVTGHTVFSIGAPLALLDALAPRHRGRPLLGRPGLVVVATLCLAAALLIRYDPEQAGSDPTAPQAWISLLAALGLAALGLSPAGRRRRDNLRPLRGHTKQRGRSVRVAVLAVVALTVLDVMPATWAGVGGYLVVLAGAGWWLSSISGSRGWGVPEVTALGVAAVVERTLLGVLAPRPPGVNLTEKVVQSAILSALVAVVAVVAWRAGRSIPEASRPDAPR